MKIDAYVVQAPHAPFVREVLELDEPGPGEVLVRIVGVGVCHTDLNTQVGDMPQPFPNVLGHEGSGVVEAVGEGVHDLVAGDHVVMGWAYCGTCRNCIRGEQRYCLRLGEALCGGHRLLGPKAGISAYRRADGSEVHGHFFGQSSFASHALANANALVKVDRDVPLEMLGPLACGITTGAGAVFNTAMPAPGDSIVVIGAGAVGLGAIMAAKNSPAAKIVALDLHDGRLALAKELGATDVVNTGERDMVEAILEICGGPADHVIDCTGSVKVIEKAVEAVAMRGSMILIGGAPLGAGFTLDHFRTLWGQRIVGTLGGGTTSQQLIPAIIALYKAGRFPFDRLVSYYDFDQIEQAIHDAQEGSTIKAVLTTAIA